MNLVFGAEGLNVGEGAFLMACCNHTDDRGYVIASMQQLADEAHMSKRAAQDNKKRLIERSLIKTAERYHPKNGARIADLLRVNIPLLEQMQRKRIDYGPTLVEELTFETPAPVDPEKRRSDPRAESAPPPAESAPPPADSAPTPRAESAPLLPPSSSPSPLSGAPSVPSVPAPSAEESTGERESSATRHQEQQRADDVVGDQAQQHDEPQRPTAPNGPVGPTCTDGTAVAEAFAAAFQAAHGRRPGRRQLDDVTRDAAEALAAGDSIEWLTETVVPFMVGRRYLDLGRARTHRDCPPPRTQGAGPADNSEWCPEHPARRRRGCLECALAVPA